MRVISYYERAMVSMSSNASADMMENGQPSRPTTAMANLRGNGQTVWPLPNGVYDDDIVAKGTTRIIPA